MDSVHPVIYSVVNDIVDLKDSLRNGILYQDESQIAVKILNNLANPMALTIL